MADLLLSLLARDSASAVFGSFAGAVVGAGKAMGDMMKSAAEAERVERQLKSVAGELTGAFQQQAKALSDQLAVEDELIMSMQTLQLRYGQAPAQVDAATRAVLDYSAATGKDAVSATEALMKGVQQGTGSIKALGIQYNATGDFATDMARATDALSKKFGGAAAADADTLAGSARAASQQMSELQESFGGFLGDMVKASGVLPAVTRMIKQLRDDLSPNKDRWDNRGDLMKERDLIQGALAAGIDSSVPGSKTRAEVEARLEEINRLLKEIDASPAAASLGLSTTATGTVKGGSGVGGGGGISKKSAQDTADERSAEVSIGMDNLRQYLQRQQDERDKAEAKREEKELAAWFKRTKQQEKEAQEEEDRFQKLAELRDRQQQQQSKKLDEATKDAVARRQRELDATINQWVGFGLNAGQMILDGIMKGMQQGVDGKGADVGMVAADTALGVIGSIFSMFGYGGMFSTLTGAMGAAQKSSTNYHAGGWPRAHGGMWMPGEVPALLQEGERVLSRAEVARMGGRGGVESAVRGGGGRNITIQAVDSQSVEELFGGRRGGRGFLNMLRSGRGPLPALLGRGG